MEKKESERKENGGEKNEEEKKKRVSSMRYAERKALSWELQKCLRNLVASSHLKKDGLLWMKIGTACSLIWMLAHFTSICGSLCNGIFR